MTEQLILHHYDNSPYAEKIRLMFGLTNMQWQSLISPVQPPRPSVDPLTGGYRRIPVAQIGADIFCDTATIAPEVVRISGCADLDIATMNATARALMTRAEKEVFFAAIGAIHPLRVLTTMMLLMGPVGTVRFAKDRASLIKGGTVRPLPRSGAQQVLQSLLTDLETHLAHQPWVNGENASIADFSIYHPLWLHVSCSRRPLKAGPRVTAWYQRVGETGHGQRKEINQQQAFDAAREAEPRALPASVECDSAMVGDTVNVAPQDYGLVPVTGTLAAVTDERIIIAREHADLGSLHVHFPRAGYSLSPI